MLAHKGVLVVVKSGFLEQEEISKLPGFLHPVTAFKKKQQNTKKGAAGELRW